MHAATGVFDSAFFHLWRNPVSHLRSLVCPWWNGMSKLLVAMVKNVLGNSALFICEVHAAADWLHGCLPALAQQFCMALAILPLDTLVNTCVASLSDQNFHNFWEQTSSVEVPLACRSVIMEKKSATTKTGGPCSLMEWYRLAPHALCESFSGKGMAMTHRVTVINPHVALL